MNDALISPDDRASHGVESKLLGNRDESSSRQCFELVQLSGDHASVFSWVRLGYTKASFALYLPEFPDEVFELVKADSTAMFDQGAPLISERNYYFITGDKFPKPPAGMADEGAPRFVEDEC